MSRNLSVHQSGMFPVNVSAQSKARFDKQEGERISDSTSVNAVVQKCGSTVSVDTRYLPRIDYLRYTDASGKSVSLLEKRNDRYVLP